MEKIVCDVEGLQIRDITTNKYTTTYYFFIFYSSTTAALWISVRLGFFQELVILLVREVYWKDNSNWK